MTTHAANTLSTIALIYATRIDLDAAV